MLYSTSAHKAGGSGFFFDDDKNAPSDAVSVSDADVKTAVNLPGGYAYDFDATGKLTTTAPSAAQQLTVAQAAQITKVTGACQAAIVAGFTSSALGAAHTYPAQTTDQQNLSASVLASLMPNLPAGWTTPFWCADANGNWSYAAHTAAQIQQVGQDGKAAIIAAIQKKAGLVAQINAATTVAAVQAITWS
ncbi:hypothetical protein R77569_04568 [Ralstonia mannitolilytica]|uniref:DUF4376 domain-containing protein n=1 Tax=Ralstonia mannitolilytica TaxID=105219 RepID=A0ABN9KL39_9RALS|nr:hypothetical protein [Ralstonia mannitolilytica]CAJ0896147.1 hypothetical protein R77569_04568 [Ralstonia mannitolilytica]